MEPQIVIRSCLEALLGNVPKYIPQELERFKHVLRDYPEYIDAQVRDWTSLGLFILHGKLEYVAMMVEEFGSDLQTPCYKFYDPLFVAMTHRRTDIVEYLYSKGYLPEWIGERGCTPLYLSIIIGDKDLIRLTYSRYSRHISTPCLESGKTPLHAACFATESIWNMVLGWGADPHVIMPDGRTLLHYVAGDENVAFPDDEVVRRVIEISGNFLDAKDGNGRTAFCMITRCGNVELLKLLVSKGSQGWKIPDNKGKMPRDHLISIIDKCKSAYIASPGLRAEYMGELRAKLNILSK